MYVVTGGTGAIGFALCVTLAQQGHPVLLTARDSERGLQAARHVATKSCCPTDMVRFAQLNVADERSVQAIAEKVLPRLGPISAIFNNAGVCIRGTSPSVLRSTFDVNFDGALRVANACRPFMTKSSAIINISSGDGELVYLCSEAQDRLKNAHSWEDIGNFIAWLEYEARQHPNRELAHGPTPAYSLSKAALNAIVRCADQNLGVEGPSWLSVCPGDVHSAMLTPGAYGEHVLDPMDAVHFVAAMGVSPAAYVRGGFYRYGILLDS